MADDKAPTLTPALLEAESALRVQFGELLEPLPRNVVHGLSPGALLGWRVGLPRDYLGVERQLRVVLPAELPARSPQLFVDPPAFLQWPHAESDGHLCLWPEDGAPIGYPAVVQLEAALVRLADLIKLVSPSADPVVREAEFAREWLSYWSQGKGAAQASGEALLLTDPQQAATALQASEIAARDGMPRRILLGNNTDIFGAWHRALGAPPPVFAQAVFARISTPPKSAPLDLEGVRALVRSDPAASAQLESLVRRPMPAPIWVVIAVASASPIVVAALELSPCPSAEMNRAARGDHKRQIREWARISAHAWRVRVQRVERADLDWIHGRGFDAEARALREKHVVVVGCGSLGGLVAEGLAHAGVGKLTLIDPQSLQAANLGRHVLDASALGKNKAVALATQLQRQLPHLQMHVVSDRVQSAKAAAACVSSDLVLSTAADWPAERYLMATLNGERALQIGWSEPHALAGHSVLSPSNPGRMLNLFDADGVFRQVLTAWDLPVMVLPGCSAAHQPSTYNRLQRIAGLIVEHAIESLLQLDGAEGHRAWHGDTRTLSRLGGHWESRVSPPSAVAEFVTHTALSDDE